MGHVGCIEYANLMSLLSVSDPSVGPVPLEMPGTDVASLGFYLPLRRMIIFFLHVSL